MHRPTIGLIAVILLAIPLLFRAQIEETVAGACLRVGIVMAILWFAQPQLRGFPRWLVFAGGGALLLVMRWPKLIVLALPVLLILWFLRPRAKRGKAPAMPGREG